MAGKTKGNSNKNQTAQARAAEARERATTELRQKRICVSCNDVIRFFGDLVPVRKVRVRGRPTTEFYHKSCVKLA